MTSPELFSINKDNLKLVQKTICEIPSLSKDEIERLVSARGKKISNEEFNQIISNIFPDIDSSNNFNRIVLNFVWTLETQILFLYPAKQKETATADFNQLRLQMNQPKVSKDLIKYIQGLLSVEGKDLGKFRKFQKDHIILSDIDSNVQISWALRINLNSMNLENISNLKDLSLLLGSETKKSHPALVEKSGKTFSRICDKFVEKYFPKDITESALKEYIKLYKDIYNTYKQMTEADLITKSETCEHGKLFDGVTCKLKDIKEEIKKNSQNSFFGKLFSIKFSNRETLVSKADEAINLATQANDQNQKINKALNEKTHLIQKLQSDYEALAQVRGHLENEILSLKEKLANQEEKNQNLMKEVAASSDALEKAHEKIVLLQRSSDNVSPLKEKNEKLAAEISSSKNIVISLYSRINKLKSDILKQEKTIG